MDDFGNGVKYHKDQIAEYRAHHFRIDELSAGFILGYTLEKNFRRTIIDTLEQHNIPRIYVDSNILGYATSSNEWHRYSLNSVYPNDGKYLFDIDRSKWDTYSKYHNVTLKPYRKNGNHIVVLCQRPNGWNMLANCQEEWIDSVVHSIRKYSDRKIVIRMHPGDSTRHHVSKKLTGKNYIVSENISILDDLKDCWCTVGYNSTPNVVSLIEGIPNIITDPIHSWANGVSDTDISKIENLTLHDRDEWIHTIANIHWSTDEIQSGKFWYHVRNYLAV
jgi:hypothetical protein